MLQKIIETTLATVQIPYLNTDIISARALERVVIEDESVKIIITLGFPHLSLTEQLSTHIETVLKPHIGTKKLGITVKTHIQPHSGNQGLKGLANIKNIIVIGSGKGGVGKSTVTFNLALGLQKAGARVGLLDADIYGPSQPLMLGTTDKKPTVNQQVLSPIEIEGIQSMSIGYLVDKNAPMIWRGPMLGKAMHQLLHDTAWHDLDYLLIDLPPGTGDVQLTLCQKIPLSTAVIVTTPQDIALADVRRAYAMFAKLKVPVVGIIENMADYACKNCGHHESIFGVGGGAKLAAEYHLPLLGQLPLDPVIRKFTDSGQPRIAAQSENPYAKLFFDMATAIAAKLSLQQIDYSRRFPKIVVEQ